MAAPAVGDALHQATGVETNIKWPNNLLSGERKICGVLSEAIETAGSLSN
jgi:BirA family transcriptional regulator, biotin operon repressor / biotin---[acetyl-CoA-carboxylase] ligase